MKKFSSIVSSSSSSSSSGSGSDNDLLLLKKKRICMVLDFDIFQVQNKYLVREIGYCSVGYPWKNESIRFDLRKSLEGMSNEDWTKNKCISSNIHGLSIRPWYREDCYDENSLEDVVKSIYKENKSLNKNIVAYKGGIYEKKLLDKLNIPSIDIEKQFGCPKIEDLVEELLLSDVADDLSCGFHSKLKNVNKIAYCSKFETFCFVKWLKLL